MGGKGGGSASTAQTAEAAPWGPTNDFLKSLTGDTFGSYVSGQFDTPTYPGIRVAPQSAMTQMGNQGLYNTAAQGNPITPTAQGAFQDLAGGANIYNDLATVKQNALSEIMPAAMSRFSQAGMLDSTLAADAAGRAATQAIAPIDYGAWDSAQNRRAQTLGMAPQLAANSYLDSSMMMQGGSGLDQYNQRLLDSAIGNYYEEANRPYDNLQKAASLGLGFGGMGSKQSQANDTGDGTMETIGGIMQIAGPIIMAAAMSDRRLKRDIRRIGETSKGFAKYAYRYVWDAVGTVRHGVMADEVPKEAKMKVGEYEAVNYSMVGV